MADGNPSSVRTPWYIWASIIAALAIFALSSYVIYYRYMTTAEANCSIVVGGDSDLEGDEVVVQKVTTGDDKLRLSDKFSKANQNSLRFFVPSATYKIDVWSREGMLLVTYPDEFVPPGTRLTLDLGRQHPPTTQPGDIGRR